METKPFMNTPVILPDLSALPEVAKSSAETLALVKAAQDALHAKYPTVNDENIETIRAILSRIKQRGLEINQKRMPLTRMLSEVTKVFTTMEAEFNPIADKWQEKLNVYAVKKLAEQRKKESEAAEKARAEQAYQQRFGQAIAAVDLWVQAKWDEFEKAKKPMVLPDGELPPSVQGVFKEADALHIEKYRCNSANTLRERMVIALPAMKNKTAVKKHSEALQSDLLADKIEIVEAQNEGLFSQSFEMEAVTEVKAKVNYEIEVAHVQGWAAIVSKWFAAKGSECTMDELERIFGRCRRDVQKMDGRVEAKGIKYVEKILGK